MLTFVVVIVKLTTHKFGYINSILQSYRVWTINKEKKLIN